MTEMKLLLVLALLTCLAVANSIKQELPSPDLDEGRDVDLYDSSDENQSDGTDQASEEALSDEDEEEEEDDTNPTITYVYQQSTGSFTGLAKDGSKIKVTGCSGSRAGASIPGELFGMKTCRNEHLCECVKDKGPLPAAM